MEKIENKHQTGLVCPHCGKAVAIERTETINYAIISKEEAIKRESEEQTGTTTK